MAWRHGYLRWSELEDGQDSNPAPGSRHSTTAGLVAPSGAAASPRGAGRGGRRICFSSGPLRQVMGHQVRGAGARRGPSMNRRGS